jgi:hypothetical protein
LVNLHRCGDYNHDQVSSFRSAEDTCWDATPLAILALPHELQAACFLLPLQASLQQLLCHFEKGLMYVEQAM